MKTELTIISDDLNHGIIDEKKARTLLLDLLGVSKSTFLDCNGDELKAGDKAIMTIKGLGYRQVEIVEHENQLQIYDEQMGHYQLIHALNRIDMVIERISKLFANKIYTQQTNYYGRLKRGIGNVQELVLYLQR